MKLDTYRVGAESGIGLSNYIDVVYIRIPHSHNCPSSTVLDSVKSSEEPYVPFFQTLTIDFTTQSAIVNKFPEYTTTSVRPSVRSPTRVAAFCMRADARSRSPSLMERALDASGTFFGRFWNALFWMSRRSSDINMCRLQQLQQQPHQRDITIIDPLASSSASTKSSSSLKPL